MNDNDTGKKRADARAVDQQRDAKDAVDRERGPSDRMRMPHERDESATENAGVDDKADVQRDTMKRAREDIESAQQDTDCRSQPNASPDCPQGNPGKRP
jgi:hypothetical protein